ncbi:MAG TPA: GNAT family N-acetyltransferase [Thermodesulfovibrionales bacterium]|nr:GNAT family N-acetyltransferase [Thermodesulfovibrionales bacterium]
MEIRAIKEGDEEGIRSLFSACFGKELSREEWVWKYRRSPWGATASVAVEGGEIVAHYGGIRMEFFFRGRIFHVYQPCDVMTHPRYRARIFSRKGAMVRAAEHFYATNPMDFAFGFASERHSILGTKQLGYTKHNHVRVLTRKVTSSGLLWRLLLKVKRGWGSIEGGDLDSLWEKVRDYHGLSIMKSSRYLFWRYRDRPAKEYLPLTIGSRQKNAPIAFAVISLGEADMCVLDFLCTETLRAGTLLKVLERIAIEHGRKNLVLWTHQGDPLFGTLVSKGFVEQKGIPNSFKVMSDTVDVPFLIENYWYWMGDYDAS